MDLRGVEKLFLSITYSRIKIISCTNTQIRPGKYIREHDTLDTHQFGIWK